MSLQKNIKLQEERVSIKDSKHLDLFESTLTNLGVDTKKLTINVTDNYEIAELINSFEYFLACATKLK